MVDLCEDCLRPKANRYRDWEARAATLCGAHLVSEGARLQCAEIKLERVVDENETLRSELAKKDQELFVAQSEFWIHRRPAGYDVNGRTFSDTFGLCSHGETLLDPCAQCRDGSGKPVAP